MPKLTYIVTHPASAYHLLQGQLLYFKNQGIEVSVITSPGEELNATIAREGINAFEVYIPREINLLRDFSALIGIYRTLKKIKPDIVNASTPKAGFLGMLAAFLARVPIRIYTLRGLRLETTHGLKHLILYGTEWLASRCAHQVVCVSHSLQELYLKMGLTSPEKTTVLCRGSSNGVNTQRFCRSSDNLARAELIRKELKLPTDSLVIGFVGRLTRDKGIIDLMMAFEEILQTQNNAHLLLVGDFETGDPIPSEWRKKITEHPRVTITGFIPDAAPYYLLMDLLAFPSYREGFPNAPLEAASSEVPIIGYSVTGTRDAIGDGKTGFLVPFKDIKAFTNKLNHYLGDPDLRRSHGQAANQWVKDNFQREKIWEAWHKMYHQLLLLTRNQPSKYADPKTDAPHRPNKHSNPASDALLRLTEHADPVREGRRLPTEHADPVREGRRLPTEHADPKSDSERLASRPL